MMWVVSYHKNWIMRSFGLLLFMQMIMIRYLFTRTSILAIHFHLLIVNIGRRVFYRFMNYEFFVDLNI